MGRWSLGLGHWDFVGRLTGMTSWTGRIVVLVLFAAVVLLPLALKPEAAVVEAGSLRLVIVTPHNEQIRYEIQRAFSKWHKAKYGQPVEIDWRASGGTSDIERQLLSEYKAAQKRGAMDKGVGYDLVFGGGDYFFDKRLKPGVDGKETILERIELPRELLSAAYDNPTLADKKLYDVEGAWYGVVLSTFGVVYNRDVLRLRGVEDPKTWEDLADPKLAGWIAMADSSHSGSVRSTYESIVQWYGFERGWKVLRGIGANSRYFTSSSSRVPQDVSSGEAAAGMSIDFYVPVQAQVVGPDRAAFVLPADAPAMNADPVAVLRGTPRKELATKFIVFMLEPAGQAVWSYRAGDKSSDLAGPERFTLGRLPVRPDFYRDPVKGHLASSVDPYATARALPAGTPSYFAVVPTVIQAMVIDTHDELVAAREAMEREPDAGTRAAMSAKLDALPFTQKELLDSPARWKKDGDSQDADRRAWTKWFGENYLEVARMGRK